MLNIAKSLHELDFGKLMAVYQEGNRENGEEFYPDLPAGQQMLRAEQDFYTYLSDCFFREPGAAYYIWSEGGHYVSALRLEPYQDGLLLEALETHPDYRRRGYAACLICAVLKKLRPEKVYSHIGHRNMASQAVHAKCGFHKVSDHARYADGSVNSYCGTYLYKAENAG